MREPERVTTAAIMEEEFLSQGHDGKIEDIDIRNGSLAWLKAFAGSSQWFQDLSELIAFNFKSSNNNLIS